MAKHVDNTVSCLTDTSMLFILSRIILVGFYVCIGVVGNGFVLRFCGKNKNLTGQVYIKALAVIDLMACVVILPQMPLFELEQDLKSVTVAFVFSLESKLHIFAYFGVQVVYALDQFIAVYWPFKHARLRRPMNYGTITGVCTFIGVLEAWDILVFVQTGFAHGFSQLHRIVITSMGFICMVALASLYSATAVKLHRRNDVTAQQKHLRNSDPAEQVQLKIYAAIFAKFVFSVLVSGVLINVLMQRWASYFFFITHIGNPVIYYCFVPKFRAAARDAIGNL